MPSKTIKHIAEVPAYSEANQRLTELNQLMRKAEDHCDELDSQLQTVPTANDQIEAEAAALLAGDGGKAVKVASLRSDKAAADRALLVAERAVKMQLEIAKTEKLKATRLVRESAAESQRKLAESILNIGDALLDSLMKHAEFIDEHEREGVEFGAPWVTPYSPRLGGPHGRRDEYFEPLRSFLNGLRSDLGK